MKKSIFLLSVFLISCLLFSCSKYAVINNADDLAGKKIGVQEGTTGELYVHDYVKNAEAVLYKSGLEAATALSNGLIDAVILDELPAREIIASYENLAIITDQFEKEEYAIAVNKSNTELLNDINSTIIALKATGEYKDLIKTFMPVNGKIVVPPSAAGNFPKLLKVGTNATFPPFEYYEDNKIVGFDITLSEKIATSLKSSIEIIDMDFDQLIPALEKGTVDFIATGMSITEERKDFVSFSVPYFESNQVIIIRNPKK